MEKNNALKVFIWNGKDIHGKKISGEIEAHNITTAKAALRNEKILVFKIKHKSKLFFSSPKKIKPKDVTIFTRQLATMLTSGIPLIQSFDIVAKGYPHPTMAKLISKIKAEVEAGHSFSKTLQQYPLLFNKLYCSLVSTGEQIGALDKILERLATYKEKIESLKAKIKKALVYPVAILLIAVIITMIILIFVIPQFQSLFSSFGAELPFLTRKVVSFSKLVSNYWWVILISIVSIVSYIKYAYKKISKFRYFIERNSLNLPLFGQLLTKAAVARFARTLATTFSAGIPIVDGLGSVSTAAGNIVFESAIKQVQYEISHGQPLHRAMRNAKCFPEMVTQMVCIGEETGKLELMLTKVADYYEEEVDITVETINTLIEPMMMLILGLIVGGLVIAMYLPIFNMGTVI